MSHTMVSLLTDMATPAQSSGGGIFRRVFGPLLGIQSKRRVRGISKTAHQLSSHSAAHGQSRAVLQAHARHQESTVAEPDVQPEGTAVPTAQSHASVDMRWYTNPDFGYARNFTDRFQIIKEIARGGNGVVSLVVDKETGKERACKSLSKRPKEDASPAKRAGYDESLRREVEVLTLLKGSLQVAQLVDVFETDDEVQIVMELCRGGELHQRIGSTHYSERTVASYLRAVLRTLAQCHSHHILHRDVKLGNFLLMDDSVRSPLKAVDFGLAVPFDPESLPVKNLPLEGTPWYMAPETLSSQVLPASDLWSAGVMAYQLLCGRFPFDDKRNPSNPAVSNIWRSVLLDEVEYDAPCWEGVSPEAISFVKSLLQRDPAARPTAKEALKHPFLAGTSRERSSGKQLLSVVARLQRFSQSSTFKRSVLQSIAAELLLNPPPAPACASGDGDDDTTTHTLSTTPQPSPQVDPARKSNSQAVDMDTSSGSPSAAWRGPPSSAAATSSQEDNAGAGHSNACLPSSLALQKLCRELHLDEGSSVDAVQLAESLTSMGYDLKASEVERLLGEVAGSSTEGRLGHVEFAASQIDYRHLQENHADRWLSLARTAFTKLDVDKDGVLCVDEIIAALRTKLPPTEIRAAVELAMREAGHGPASAGMEFVDFMRMLKVRSTDSLDIYDNRSRNGSSHRGSGHSGSGGRSGSRRGRLHADSVERLNLMLQGQTSSPPAERFNFLSNGKTSEYGSPNGSQKRKPDMRGMTSPDNNRSRQDLQNLSSAMRSVTPSPMEDGSAAATAAPPPVVWRFDVHTRAAPPTPSPLPPKAKASTPAPLPADPAFAQSSTDNRSVGSAAMERAWNFDPVSRSSSKQIAVMDAAKSAAISIASFARPAVVMGPGTSGEVAGRGAAGGHFDKRHHGSGLYKSMEMSSSPPALSSVEE